MSEYLSISMHIEAYRSISKHFEAYRIVSKYIETCRTYRSISNHIEVYRGISKHIEAHRNISKYIYMLHLSYHRSNTAFQHADRCTEFTDRCYSAWFWRAVSFHKCSAAHAPRVTTWFPCAQFWKHDRWSVMPCACKAFRVHRWPTLPHRSAIIVTQHTCSRLNGATTP